MNIRSSTTSNLPVQESSQELHLELVRHYTDVLRLFTDRLSPVVSEPNPVVPAPAPVVSGPSSEVPEPDRSSCWESAESLLAGRDWHAEKIVHLPPMCWGSML